MQYSSSYCIFDYICKECAIVCSLHFVYMDLEFFHKILSVDSTSGKEAELADILSVELAAPGSVLEIHEFGLNKKPLFTK